MIYFDFAYYKPDTVKEAINIYKNITSQGKKAIYYGGGTEFISMARMNNVYADAVIDYKSIAECNIHEVSNGEYTLGSATTLTDIVEKNLFPLLSLTAGRIADHTIQGKITLGGNLAGTIIYKEAILPIMLSDGEVIVEGINGRRRIAIMDFFRKKPLISKDELIVQIIIKEKYLSLPSIHVKRTKYEKIDYPLITLATLREGSNIRIAFSGLYEYPFRSREIEDILNNNSISIKEKLRNITNSLDDKVLNDVSGSSEYRIFMVYTMLEEVLKELGGDS